MIKPIGDKVLVRMDEPPEREGLIHLVRTEDSAVHEPTFGVVVSVGEGKTTRCYNIVGFGTEGAEWGFSPLEYAKKIIPPDVSVGDRVAFDHWSMSNGEFEYGGVMYRVLERDEVLAVLED